MFRHVVLFSWKDDVSDGRRRAVMEGLAKLPTEIPEVRAFQFGEDAGLGPDNFDLAVVADFDDAEAYRRYAAHPAHTQLVADVIRPVVTQRAAVQYVLRAVKQGG